MSKKPTKLKMYTVQYHIMAKNVMDARKIAKKTEPDEIWINNEWKNGQNHHLADAIGFVETPP